MTNERKRREEYGKEGRQMRKLERTRSSEELIAYCP
jgi:hypothetical protein